MSFYRSNLWPAIAGLCLNFVFIIPVAAEDTAEALEPVVVTAVRGAQAPEEALASVSLITRADIERIQPPDLLELLRLEAGIDLARAGGPGAQTGLFMRGTNSNHVLVLIDGVRVAASGTGAFAWEILDVALIERIEIVRGPHAARWGSDAIGGVIQIFTRTPEGTTARAAYGRYRDRSLSAATGRQASRTPFSLVGSARRVGGFSAQNERGFAFDPDNDGFENNSASAGGSFSAGPGRLDWRLRGAAGEVDFDQGESEFANYAGRLAYRIDGRGPWSWQIDAAAYRDRLETATEFGINEVVTRRTQTGLVVEREFAGHTRWLSGADAWRESGVSRGQWTESRYNLGAWTGLDGRAGRLAWEAAVRVDEDELFGSAINGNLAAGWQVHPDWRVSGSLGRAFRAPNFSQLFSPGFFGLFAGNPDLEPETSWSAELGAGWTFLPGHRLELSLWTTWVDDLIDFAGTDFQAINVRSARIRGAEVEYDLQLGAWFARASYTWQDAEDRDAGLPLLRRPSRKLTGIVDRSFGNGARLGAELVFIGSRRDVGQERLPSHTLINLRGAWPVGGGIELEARLENLTDRDYEPVIGFNAHRRSLFVAVVWEG